MTGWGGEGKGMGKLLGKGDSAWSWCQYCALKKSAGLSAVYLF